MEKKNSTQTNGESQCPDDGTAAATGSDGQEVSKDKAPESLPTSTVAERQDASTPDPPSLVEQYFGSRNRTPSPPPAKRDSGARTNIFFPTGGRKRGWRG
jgi:hypothetical protein